MSAAKKRRGRVVRAAKKSGVIKGGRTSRNDFSNFFRGLFGGRFFPDTPKRKKK